MKYFIIFLVLVAAVGGGAYVMNNRAKAAAAASASTTQNTTTVGRMTIEKLVTANGKIASNRDADIKCQASGTIMELPYNDVSAEVKPGALLLKLDPKDEQRLLDTARAAVMADQARLQEAQLNWNVAKLALETTRSRNEAALASAQARASDAHAKADRTKQLFDSALSSKEDLETAQTTATSADADVKNAQAAMEELKQQSIQIDTREQTIKEMQSALDQDTSREKSAEDNVGYCTVTAPEADDPKDPPHWVISSLLTNIAKGGVVQSGTSGFSGGTTIMTLSDLSHVFVLASVAESDVGQLADPATGAHQKVRVTVDAFRDEVFYGEVVRVAPKGVLASNVVTVEVKIEITSDNRLKLKPELTATANIICDSRVNVLAIPVESFVRAADNADAPAATADTAPAATLAAGTGPATTSASQPGRGRRGRGGAGATIVVKAAGSAGPVKGTVTVVTDGKSTDRNVTVGLTDGEWYEVISGLDEGDTVVKLASGADSRYRGQGTNPQQLMRGLTGGGGGGRGR